MVDIWHVFEFYLASERELPSARGQSYSGMCDDKRFPSATVFPNSVKASNVTSAEGDTGTTHPHPVNIDALCQC